MDLDLRNMKFNLVNQLKLNSMKSDSLKNNQHPELDSVASKKLWVNPEVEIISILSGRYRFPGREGQFTSFNIDRYYS